MRAPYRPALQADNAMQKRASGIGIWLAAFIGDSAERPATLQR